MCGLLYLYSRFKYFQGYAVAAQGRLVPGRGCGHPKPAQRGWVRDVSPGAGFLPAGGTEGRFASPPSAPIRSWPHQLFPSTASEEDGGRQALASTLRAPAGWWCLTVFSPCTGWGRCTPAPGCSGCCWGWRWLGSWHTFCCPAPLHGWQRLRSPSSCSVPRERGDRSPKTTPRQRGGSCLAWSEIEYLPSSVLTFEGRWMLAHLCSQSSALQR